MDDSLKNELDNFDWEDDADEVASSGELTSEDLDAAFDDEDFDDGRGAIEYDDYGDGNEEGTGYVDDVVGDSDDSLEGAGLSEDDSIGAWYQGLMSDEEVKNASSVEDDNYDDAAGDEADKWLSEHDPNWVKKDESLESLNAKEAVLREALHAVRQAKLKLLK